MSLGWIAALLGLAFLDAMNPFSIAAMVFLLSTDRPAPRGLVFLVGTFAVYLFGGVVLLEGWLVVLRTFLPSLPGWAPGSLEMLAGGLAVGAGLYAAIRAAGGKTAPSPTNLSLPATLAFAIVSTVSDLPTAIPLFAAVNQIAATGDGAFARYGWLAFYTVIYVTPLIAMLAASLALGQRAEPTLVRVRQAVDWTFARLLPSVLVLAGIALLIDGARRVFAVLD
jgi:hypothetical protein